MKLTLEVGALVPAPAASSLMLWLDNEGLRRGSGDGAKQECVKED